MFKCLKKEMEMKEGNRRMLRCPSPCLLSTVLYVYILCIVCVELYRVLPASPPLSTDHRYMQGGQQQQQ